MSRPIIKIKGMGVLLPGISEACETMEAFRNIVFNGECCLSEFDYPGIPLKLAGQIKGWVPESRLNFKKKYLEKYSRATLFAMAAFQNALEDSGLNSEDLSNDRTVIIVCSTHFNFGNASGYLKKLDHGGCDELGFEYWLNGTSGSILTTVCYSYNIECPTLTVTGGCNAGARGLHIAYDMLHSDQIDRAIIISTEAPLDPIFLSGTVYQSKKGFRSSSLSEDPGTVRPHDQTQCGNSVGEGAVATILEADRSEDTEMNEKHAFRVYCHTSRKNGSSPVFTESPINIVKGIKKLLDQAGISLDDVGFVNDFCEGGRMLENFFCEGVKLLREQLDYHGDIHLTNQEAAFSHSLSNVGMIKFLSNALMMEHKTIAPSVNCQQAYEKLLATPVIGKAIPMNKKYSLLISGGGGGDFTSILLEAV